MLEMVSMGVQVATLPDGRKLGYCIVGKGSACYLFSWDRQQPLRGPTPKRYS